MADGRFLSRSIAVNEQLASVSIEAALFFTWCIPHCDIEGRLPGSPMSVKANVFPLREEITIKRIPKLIEELGSAVDPDGVSLVVWYQVGRQQVLMFPGFTRQQKLRRDREGVSKLPALSRNARILSGSIGLGNSGSTPGVTPGAGPGATPEKCVQGEGEVEVQGEVQGEGATPGVAPPPPSRRRELAERLTSDADRRALDALLARVPVPDAWVEEMLASLEGMPGHTRASPEQLGEALRDYAGNGALANPGLKHFRAYVRRAATSARPSGNGDGRSSESDDLQTRVKLANPHVITRRNKPDGDAWWLRVQAEARQRGAANDGEVILYAAEHV